MEMVWMPMIVLIVMIVYLVTVKLFLSDQFPSKKVTTKRNGR